MRGASQCADDVRLRVHADDEERLAVLSQCEVLDTQGEPDFEMLVEVIKVQCNVPMAAISFIDRERMWMKAARGFEVAEVPRMSCFCSVCMHSKLPMIVEDASLDARFRENPFVVGEPRLRFYAGFPVFSREGFGLGSVCAMDIRSRSLSAGQMELMAKTRDWVEAVMEERRLESLWKTGAFSLCGDAKEDGKADRAWAAVRQLV